MNKKISDYNAGIEYALRIAHKGGVGTRSSTERRKGRRANRHNRREH